MENKKMSRQLQNYYKPGNPEKYKKQANIYRTKMMLIAKYVLANNLISKKILDNLKRYAENKWK